MNPPTALAILTYVDASRPSDVGRRLPDAIASLEATNYGGPVFVVDDGSTCANHLAYLRTLERSGRYVVIYRPENGGISRAKNTCLRAIMDAGAEIGFLVEDDILFAEGWDSAYVDAMRRSRIRHFSWYLPEEANRVVACNEEVVTITAGLLGLLATFTREVVETVGGFKVLPHRYGFEHINWTYRIVHAGLAPFPADIFNSSRFVRRNSLPSSLEEAEIRAGAEANRIPGYELKRIHEPLSE